MSRIRSIHPGFARDEDYVEASRDARLFFLLLLTECDDQGVFEWKPKTLKMATFPADNIDVAPLLSELLNINAVISYEIGGRKYGAVRNFRKYQRPKSPNAIHPLPPEFRKYVGLSPPISEMERDDEAPVPHHSPTPSEIPPQMEGEGVRREEESDANASPKTESAHERRSRGTRLPPDWEPDEQDRDFACTLELNPDAITAEFRDYWIAVPGQRGVKLDWSATFRNRCRELAKRGGSAAPQRPANGRQAAGGVVAALRQLGSG